MNASSAPHLVLLNEVANLISVGRESDAWTEDSHIIRYGSVDRSPSDSPLNALEASVTALREEFQDVCRAGSLLEYLTPFLDVVKSPDTSAKLTAASLQSVQRMLQYDLIGRWGTGASSSASETCAESDIATGMRTIAEAVTQCKFESSRTDQDECVLDRILDVFTALIKSPQSKYLRHEDVIAVFQACYRIGHMRTDRGKHSSSMLTQSSQRAMMAVVEVIFSRVGRGEVVEEVAADEGGEGHGTKSPMSMVSRQLVDLEDDDDEEEEENDEVVDSSSAHGGAKEVSNGEDAGRANQAEENAEGRSTSDDTDKGAQQATAELRGTDGDLREAGEEESRDDGTREAQSQHQPPPPPVTVSVQSALASTRPESSVPSPTHGPQWSNYGVPVLGEVLAFIISMIGSKPSKHYPELPLAGIELVTACVRACVCQGIGGGTGSGTMTTVRHPLPPSLMIQLKQDLFRALFSAASHGVHQSRCLAAICQVGIVLYALFRDVMLPQIEALVSLLILPIAESSQHLLLRRTALEGLLDFCRQPGFLATTYVNCDCRIGGVGGIGDALFKRICEVISRSAKVTDEEGVSKFHGIAMEGIRTVFDAISTIQDGSYSYSKSGAVSGHGQSRKPSMEFGYGSGQNPSAREYVDIWTPLCAGELLDPEASPSMTEKDLMTLLESVAERFNEHQKKGLEFCQEIKLLPTPLTATSVARFLKGCPGLSKAAIGEVLGERDEFYEDIREEFCNTFDFGGMRFDVALRLFMDAFRPPGEGQKIDRIVQSFGKKYYEQVPKSGLKSADAAYVLAFSVIMLNTDLHNTQNKRKMTLEDFGRINRNTNEGDPMPPELLSSIYAAISVDEFKISSECSAADLSHQAVFWATLAGMSTKPRGRPVDDAAMFQALHELRREIFAIAWDPAMVAISSILDASSNPKTVKNATGTLFVAAELGYRHKIQNVIDQVLQILVKYTTALDYSDLAMTSKPSLAYGASIKARSSVETMFKIADMYGDSMKSGWACIVSVVMKVFVAELLTPEIIAVDGESVEQAAERMPKPRPRNKGQSSSIFTRAINSLISIEADGDLEYANAGGQMLRDMAKKSISSCSIESLVNDSKFLIVESLIELISSIISSGKASLALAKTEGTSGHNNAVPLDTVELSLELLFSLTLRNRDRITLFWPRIHEFLATCTSEESASMEGFAIINKRTIDGLMRICQRILPYKEDTAEMLLGSLSLVGEMQPRIVWELAPSISTELITLLSQSAPHIRTETGWRTITILIRILASREEVLPYSLQALQLACQNPQAVSTESYIPLLETCLQLIDGFKAVNPDVAAEFLECADSLFTWLSSGDRAACSATSPSTATLLDLWLTSVGILTKGLCRESSEKLRHASVESLHKMLIASCSLNLPPDMWVQTLRELVLPLVSDFAKAMNAASRKRSLSEATKSLQMAIDMLVSVVSKYAPSIASDGDFNELAKSTLLVLSGCEAAASSVKENATVLMIQERVKVLESLPAFGQKKEQSSDPAGTSSVTENGVPTLVQPTQPIATQPTATRSSTSSSPRVDAKTNRDATAMTGTDSVKAERQTEVENNISEEPPTCQQS